MQSPHLEPAITRWPIAFLRPALAVVLLVSAGLALVAPAGAQRLPPDPVEQFKAALKLEQSPSYEIRGEAFKKAIAFRKKNLLEKAGKLKTVSELSRALLLVEWRSGDIPRGESKLDYYRDSRFVERDVRELISQRFIQQVRALFKKAQAKEEQAEAVANLIAETVSSASGLGEESLTLYTEFSPLARDVAQVVESDRPLPTPRVRVAVSRALSQFPTAPDAVLPVLERFMVKDNPPEVRRAAAQALITLALVVAGRDQQRPSEPGVAIRESKPTNQNFKAQDKMAVAVRVVPVAGKGLTDRNPEVRKLCAEALHQIAITLGEEVPRPLVGGASDNPYPPGDREWSKEEMKEIEEGRKAVKAKKAFLEPAIAAFAKQAGPLSAALRDRDSEVRLNAVKTIDELGRLRRLLREYANTVPAAPLRRGKVLRPRARPAPAGAALPRPKRAKAPSGIRLVDHRVERPAELPLLLPPLPSRKVPGAVRQGPKADKGGPEKKPEAGTDALLQKLLGDTGEATIREGLADPKPAGRRAALEAIEGIGKLGAPYIADMVKALKDRDVFVRWIAARALGRLAPREPKTVVPGLVRLLDDEDLDLRIIVATAIGQYGPAAGSAVPALRKTVGRGDSEARVAAMKALERIGLASVPALPDIAAALKNTDPRVRTEAARVLGRFGNRAKDTLPALRPLMRDLDPEVRKTASEAILQIMVE